MSYRAFGNIIGQRAGPYFERQLTHHTGAAVDHQVDASDLRSLIWHDR